MSLNLLYVPRARAQNILCQISPNTCLPLFLSFSFLYKILLFIKIHEMITPLVYDVTNIHMNHVLQIIVNLNVISAGDGS